VTRGWLPQRARLPGRNGGGAAATVPQNIGEKTYYKYREVNTMQKKANNAKHSKTKLL